MELTVVANKLEDASIGERAWVGAKAGQVIVKLDKVAFTANVVSYGMGGDSLGYFKFFPTESAKEPGRKGSTRVILPSWGVGTVVVSRHEKIAPGEKLYGFFPFGSEFCTLTVSKLRDANFVDLSEHRKELSQIYNTYQRLDKGWDPLYASGIEDLMLVYRPLFLTSWLLKQHTLDIFRSAKPPSKQFQVILVSASSKTAYALAYLLKHTSQLPVKVVGLTSPANVRFVSSLKVYDQVVEYDQVSKLVNAGVNTKTSVVDMSGNAKALRAILANIPTATITLVGLTHWKEGLKLEKLPGTFFFAPAFGAELAKQMGGQENLDAALRQDWFEFIAHVQRNNWCEVQLKQGPEQVMGVYKSALERGVNPKEGIITSMSSMESGGWHESRM